MPLPPGSRLLQPDFLLHQPCHGLLQSGKPLLYCRRCHGRSLLLSCSAIQKSPSMIGGTISERSRNDRFTLRNDRNDLFPAYSSSRRTGSKADYARAEYVDECIRSAKKCLQGGSRVPSVLALKPPFRIKVMLIVSYPKREMREAGIPLKRVAWRRSRNVLGTQVQGFHSGTGTAYRE